MRHLILLLFILTSLSLFAQTEKKTSVYFDVNISTLTDYQKRELLDLKKLFEKGHARLSSVEAYTDTTGSVKYNNVLARKRGNSVLNFLERSSEIQPTVFGENYFVTANYTDQQHRRVDIHYVLVEPAPKVEEPVVQEVPKIVSKFTEFVADTAVTETMIELSLHFVPGKAILLAESNAELWSLFDFMHYNENMHAFIRGHVCCSDDMSLSIERASVVYNFLKQRSISEERMKYEGYSNTMPAVSPEITEEDQKRNRRVDIIFTKVK